MKPFFHLIVWLIVFGATLSGYWIWYGIIAERSVAVVELQNEINAKTETADRVASARATLADLTDDEAAIQGYFISETRLVPLIGDLEARARAQGATLKVKSVAQGAMPKQPTLELALSVDGSFDAVMRTVGAIEYAPYHLTLARLAVSSSGKDTWHAELALTVGSVPATAAPSSPAAQKSVSLFSRP